jgi:hypothetical protein
MVVVNFDIALGLDGKIKKTMDREQREHVVHKWDSGLNIGLASAVDFKRHLNGGFSGSALDFTSSGSA